MVEKRERLTGRFLESPFFARVDEILSHKEVKVKRTYLGNEIDINCHVTQTVKDEFLGGKIVVGDIVIIQFIEADLSKPVILGKLVK
ncbi:unnamed protein product [marine sediment metagenome]|uniref:TRAM domain-containing protein n=1 Tax=marine sediment metagenome TaxID=412755 RepID=X1HLV5_9ZZZZ